MRRFLLAAWLCALGAAAQAQLSDPDPDWKEEAAPPPPALSLDKLIAVEVPRATLRYGVDPASISLTKDGIVRYVVVASSASGAVNAFYEGVRCSSAETKTYARHNADSGWVAVKDAQWRALHNDNATRHSLIIARTGLCVGGGPNRSAATMVRDLRSPVDSRFNNESR